MNTWSIVIGALVSYSQKANATADPLLKKRKADDRGGMTPEVATFRIQNMDTIICVLNSVDRTKFTSHRKTLYINSYNSKKKHYTCKLNL